MKISVLLSLYSGENPSYFEKAMLSIWDDQKRKPDEIVLVHDGLLTQKLYNIIDEWKLKLGSRLVNVQLNINVGLAKALNEGVKYCTGDYIARMDTDDIALPNRFELQEIYLVDNPNICLLGGGMIEIDEYDNEISRRLMPSVYKDIKKTFPKTNPFVHPSVIISKKIFGMGLRYSEHCKRNQDAELWFRIMAVGFEVGNISDYIIKFRKSAFMYSKRKKSAFSELKIFIKGTYLLYGLFTYRYIYPLFHYFFRLLPPHWSLFVYKNFIVKYWGNKKR